MIKQVFAIIHKKRGSDLTPGLNRVKCLQYTENGRIFKSTVIMIIKQDLISILVMLSMNYFKNSASIFWKKADILTIILFYILIVFKSIEVIECISVT